MLNNKIEYTLDDFEAIQILEDFIPDIIFDSHAHLYDSDFLPEVFKNTVRTVTDINTYADALSPMLCCPKKLRLNIIPYPVDISLADKLSGNLKKSDNFLISQLNTSPDNVGEIIILPDDTTDSISARLSHKQIRGLKCYYCFSDESLPGQSSPDKYLPVSAWEIAHKNKMCITLHLVRDKSLSDPENLRYIKTMASSYPDAILILAHSARAFASWTCVEMVHELAHYDNIWFDFSAICESPSIFQIFRKIGTSKCMWGSDYPVCTGHGKVISVADGFCWLGNKDLPSSGKKWLIGIENLMALRQASIMAELGPKNIEDIFYNNASVIFDA